MERLPFDIQELIYRKAHALNFKKCLEEIPFKVGVFYHEIDTSIDDIMFWNDRKGITNCIPDFLIDHYLDRRDELIERLAQDITIDAIDTIDTMERLINEPYSDIISYMEKDENYTKNIIDYVIGEIRCNNNLKEKWTFGFLVDLMEKDYNKPRDILTMV